MTGAARRLIALLPLVVACSVPSDGWGMASGPDAAMPATAAGTSSDARAAAVPAERPASPCGGGKRLTVRFFDVGEGLAALVALPDGRHVLVDAGDGAKRAGCGEPCERSARHMHDRIRDEIRTRDAAEPTLDLLWITHQHADHIGGAPDVLRAFHTRVYADNGRDAGKPEVRRARTSAVASGAQVAVVDPTHRTVPLPASRDVTFTAVVPPSWPPACDHDPNECSIGLRIDYCASSVLFTGDAEHEEEALLDPGGPVTLLQVGHHGSETSTTPALLAKAHPKYAVISAGKPDERYNRAFCHPRASIVRRLTRLLGGSTGKTLEAFDGERCDRAVAADWISVPTSDAMWATERDGDVLLVTTGDGVFHREGS